MLDSRLVVLAGSPERGKELHLSPKPRFLVVKEKKEGWRGKASLSITLEENPSEDDRLVEIYAKRDRVHIRNLRPWQSVSINGDQSLEQGQRAGTKDGDIIIVRDVVLRVKQKEMGNDPDSEIMTSSEVEPQDDVESTILQTQESADAADLIKALPSDRAKLEKRVRCLENVTAAALAAESANQLLDAFLGLLGDEFPTAKGAILWRVSEKGSFKRVAGLRCESKELRVSRTVIRHVLDTRAGVLSQDTSADDRLSTSESLAQKGMRAVLCMPITLKDRVAGVLHLDDEGFGVFDEADLTMVAAAARTVSAALTSLDRRKIAAASGSGSGVRGSGARGADEHRWIEAVSNATLLTTTEGGLRAGGVHVAIGALDETPPGGVFTDAMALAPPPGTPLTDGPVLLVMGEVGTGGPASAIGAIKANAAARTLAPYASDPVTLVRDIGRILATSGQPPEGSTVVARFDPGSGALAVAVEGNPIVLHCSAARGTVSRVGANAQSDDGMFTIELAPNDVVLLATQGLYGPQPAASDLSALQGLVAQQVSIGPVGLVNAVIATALQHPRDRAAAIVALRREG